MTAYHTENGTAGARIVDAGGAGRGLEVDTESLIGADGTIRADLIAVAGMIRARRIVLKMSQTELAQRIGATQAWVSALENGRPNLRFGQVLKAMAVLGIGFAGFSPGTSRTAGGRRPPVRDDDFPDIDSVVDGDAL